MANLVSKLNHFIERLALTVKNGFAFVELIVLAAIFGIVAAFALPRFSALDDAARSSSIKAMGADIRMTSALVHTIWLAEGQPPHIALGGRVIGLVHGYPDLESIDAAVSIDRKYAYDAASGRFALVAADGTVDPNCVVAYAEASAWGQAPQVSIATHGC